MASPALILAAQTNGRKSRVAFHNECDETYRRTRDALSVEFRRGEMRSDPARNPDFLTREHCAFVRPSAALDRLLGLYFRFRCQYERWLDGFPARGKMSNRTEFAATQPRIRL